MKNQLFFSMLFLCMLTLWSCEKSIEEVYNNETSSEIPINFNACVLKVRQTRFTGSFFEEGDSLSLYITQKPNQVSETRFEENIKLNYVNKKLVPEKALYYPYGSNVKCDFFSFYPYEAIAIEPNSSVLPIKIATNQQTTEAYTTSDFLSAKTTEIAPSKNPVDLNYEHKLSQISLYVQTPSALNIEALMKDAKITIDNVYTTANFDVDTQTLSGAATPATVTPNGTWSVVKDQPKLTGMRAILIPQNMDNSSITLQILDKTFISKLPEGFTLTSGSSYDIILKYNPNIGIESMNASISEWKAEKKTEIETQQSMVNLNDVNFDNYSLYDIKNAKNAVKGTLCMEYLKDQNIDSKAIVFYPAQTPLEGTVLQLIGNQESVHGGKVVWNKAENTFTYTPGTKAAATALYINEQDKVVFEAPAKPAGITAIEQVLTDKRGETTEVYAIVKIGCQYFMKENLRATMLNDGSAIVKHTQSSQTEAGYMTNNGDMFYNKSVAESSKLAPTGWKVPDIADWDKLKAYIGNDVSTLKTTREWVNSNACKPGNNKTGFSAYPAGLMDKATPEGQHKAAIYWMITTETNPEVLIGVKSDKMNYSKLYPDDYLNIRCVRIDQ